MYSILFHILCLSLLEIIFYFEYIGPLESLMFKKTLTRIITNEYNTISNYIDNSNNYNTSNINNIGNYSSFIDMEYSSTSEEDRNDYNHKLYMTTILYWLYYLISISFIYFVMILYKYITYRQYIKNKDIVNNGIDIECTPFKHRSYSIDSDDLTINYTFEHNSFIDCNNIKKTYKKDIIYYLCTGCLILLFEYLFFTYIVMKYKILSDDEISYEIYELIDQSNKKMSE